MLRYFKNQSPCFTADKNREAGGFCAVLQQDDSMPSRRLPHVVRPDRYLDLPDMGLAQIEHTEPGLADAAAYGVGELLFQDGLLEGEVFALLASGQRELERKGLLVHPDAHGGQLQSVAENGIPDNDVAV